MDLDRSPTPAWSFTGYERIAESLERWIGDDEAAYLPWTRIGELPALALKKH